MDHLDYLFRLLLQPTNILGSAVIATLVSACVGYFFKVRETHHRLETEYRYEQRKKLRDVIARYHGRLLSLANSMNYRMWNLYQNHDSDWLKVNGKYKRDNYYFLTFAFRFLNLFSLIRAFEREAIFIDARIAQKQDLQIYNFISALQWCMTDVALFDEIPYDKSTARDHFFSDTLRQLCDDHLTEKGIEPSYDSFVTLCLSNNPPIEILNYFDDLSKTEDRLRWDRLVVFHLLLIGLINAIGQSAHKTGGAKITIATQEIGHPKILKNFVQWLPRHEVSKIFIWQIRFAIWRSKRKTG